MFSRRCPGALQKSAIVTAGEPVTRRRVRPNRMLNKASSGGETYMIGIVEHSINRKLIDSSMQSSFGHKRIAETAKAGIWCLDSICNQLRSHERQDIF
jgi:hypothetical protein